MLSRGRAREVTLLGALVVLGLAPACKRSRESRAPDGTPFDDMVYRTGDVPAGARLLLVAGGSDIANFAAEVVSQRELWLAQGVPGEQIVCYYAKPTPRAYEKDREQYDALRPELDDCFAANPAVVNTHLRQLAANAPPFVYLYVTGHGLGSVLRAMGGSGKHRDLVRSLTDEERSLLDRPAVGLEAEGGPGVERPAAIVSGIREGRAREELMFEPEALADALSGLPPATPKFVVIQACYSGAFLPNRRNVESPLTGVSNLTMLTATRFDRPSFGCGSADVATYFGGAFTRVLARALEEGQGPPDVPWRQVYDDTAFIVETWERVEGERPSHPQMLETSVD